MDLSLKPCTSATRSMDTDVDVDVDGDGISKPCTTTTSLHKRIIIDRRPLEDRLSSLPIELLIHILSLLPTKDAAATCALSKRLSHVFPWITCLDFDVSPLSFCTRLPNKYKPLNFPSFVTFVDTVLGAHRSKYLTRFRLRVSIDLMTRLYRPGCYGGCYHNDCLPDLSSNQIHWWISFPFTRCGLKDLDLCLQLKDSGHGLVQLPPTVFMCETLETLKLDINLALDQIYTTTSFCLPNLKLLHLFVSEILEDGFVTTLLSSCPLLEDLTIDACWHRVHFLKIALPSLRRLYFNLRRYRNYTLDDTDLVVFDTPKLEYLTYIDEGESWYSSITNLDCIVKASIEILNCLKLLSFVKLLYNVKHLFLYACLNAEPDSVEVMDQLPVFRNLRFLEIGDQGNIYWDIVLLEFLKRSPVLEILAFPEGFGYNDYQEHALVSDKELFRTTPNDPPECCKSHLKKIVINSYYADEREKWF